MGKKKLIIEISIFIVSIIIIAVVYNWVVSYNIEKKINNKEESKVSVLEITNENFAEEVINSNKTVVADFYATWCGPCKMMSPIIENIANEVDTIKVVKIDIDKNEDLAIQYNVMSIPTIIIFKQGEISETFVGVTDKEKIIEAIK